MKTKIALFGILVCIALLPGCLNPGPDVVILGGEKWVTSQHGNLTFRATDNSGGNITCDVEVNGLIVASRVVQSGVDTVQAITLPAIDNVIRVKATDKAGNSAWSDSLTLHVDTVPPTVIIVDFRESP